MPRQKLSHKTFELRKELLSSVTKLSGSAPVPKIKTKEGLKERSENTISNEEMMKRIRKSF